MLISLTSRYSPGITVSLKIKTIGLRPSTMSRASTVWEMGLLTDPSMYGISETYTTSRTSLLRTKSLSTVQDMVGELKGAITTRLGPSIDQGERFFRCFGRRALR